MPTILSSRLASGVNSPIRTFAHVGCEPILAARGSGSKIISTAGASYTDYCQSWGALVLGHAHPKIVQNVKNCLEKGSSFGMTTEIEYEIADRIVGLVPSLDCLRFVSSGTEATMTAARIARGYTGRPYIVKCNGHYHGHADLFLVKPGSGATDLSGDSFSEGVPREVVAYTKSVPFNDLDAMEEVLSSYDVAAIIIEPVAGNMGTIPAQKTYLESLRRLTEEKGTLLIFDEVITGFRVALGGAQQLYGVTADLVTYGKIIGGGFPVGAVGGRQEIMDVLAPKGGVYQAGTLSGNPVAMTAGNTTLALLEKDEVHARLEVLGKRLEKGMSHVLRSGSFQRVGSMFCIFFGIPLPQRQEDLHEMDQDRFVNFFRFMLTHGVYIPQSAFETSFLSFAHTENDVDRFIELVEQFERSV